MARRCTVCDHRQREEIDHALVEGESLRDIARRHSLSKDAVARHKAEHLPTALTKAKEGADAVHADDLLGKIRGLEKDARRICGRAEAEGDYRTALAGIRELTRLVELIGKLAGELDDRPQINVLLAPQWLEVRSVLLKALAPYPQARASVAQSLQALEVPHDNEYCG